MLNEEDELSFASTVSNKKFKEGSTDDGFLVGALLSMPRMALAGSGSSFLETLGISIAVGTVLGASTLPFYETPGNHLLNLAFGAGAGVLAGVGLGVYGVVNGDDPGRGDENFYFDKSQSRNTQFPSYASTEIRSRQNVDRPKVWLPLVSLSW